ncbi:MAG: hypothetical protein C0623_10110 [Desulfuromonas sp.]|nr:MAG: hypothetical protein C0623_10110 [Desulfuromonas sp.]
MMIRRSLLIFVLFFATAQVCLAANVPMNISATVLSKSICRFVTKTATLDFGNLDPTSPSDVVVNATLTLRCQGSANPATYLITDDDGLYETGVDGNRMQHATIPGNFLPYAVTYTPATATIPKNINQSLTITGTLLGADYATAISGVYNDTVTLTIAP